MRQICIHGHFYQPPREDPGTGRILPQPSAAPHRDWNHRITEECYRANGHAAVWDDDGDILYRQNNYRHISFNFGPTLMRWLTRFSPDVHASILDADRMSRLDNNGHGNAMGQVYHHAILPLCSAEDKLTEVLWGQSQGSG